MFLSFLSHPSTQCVVSPPPHCAYCNFPLERVFVVLPVSALGFSQRWMRLSPPTPSPFRPAPLHISNIHCKDVFWQSFSLSVDQNDSCVLGWIFSASEFRSRMNFPGSWRKASSDFYLDARRSEHDICR